MLGASPVAVIEANGDGAGWNHSVGGNGERELVL